MKKIYLITILILSSIILFTGNTYAVTNMVSLKLSDTEVEEKETFTMTISAKSGDDVTIDGLSACVKYDENILEMVSSDLIDSKNWSNLEEFPNLAAIWVPSTSETNSADIYKITFKVKEGITSKSTQIKLTDIVLSTSNDEISVEDLTETVQINKSENNKNDSNETNGNNSNESNKNDGNKVDENNKNNIGNDNNTDKTSNSNNVSKINNNKVTNNISINSVNVATSNSNLPYTGGILNKIIISLIVVFVVLGIRGYTLYKKYKGI